MTDPYVNCPVFENQNYLIRLIMPSDDRDLFLVYSDEKAVPFFNSDNCSSEFHYTQLEHMQGAIEFWLQEYRRRRFVRWTIIDKRIPQAVGTIELFNRHAGDYFDNCGLLRLDLRSDYEHEEEILEILSMIIQPAFALFDCGMIATKIPAFAGERKKAAERAGFSYSEEKLIGGDDRKVYQDYYVMLK